MYVVDYLVVVGWAQLRISRVPGPSQVPAPRSPSLILSCGGWGWGDATTKEANETKREGMLRRNPPIPVS